MSRLWIGTSGFSYPEWQPTFYPEKLPKDEFLAYYATLLDTVEINSTFYRMPNAKTIERWKASTPEEFRFAIKASQKITHRERLKLPSESLAYLIEAVSALGPRLGVVLFQLPPNFKLDRPRLEMFLGEVPPRLPCAFEFRHASWFTDEVYDLLRRRKVGLCVHDADEETTPAILTAGPAYVRLRKTAYAPDALASWRERMGEWVASGVDVYAYIKHEDNPDAPRIALELAG